MDQKSSAILLIRIVLSAVLFIHGAARISYGTVDDFGGFLETQGFPLGFYIAWAITIFELVGSVLLAFGLYAWIIALIFVAELLAGIVMVHAREGWFVVGHGRNGMEFSVVLIACLIAVAYANYHRK